MKFRPRIPFWFSTVHGQITAIVLLGLLVVIIGGPVVERWSRRETGFLDMEDMAGRVHALASILKAATPAEREVLLDTARRSGWDVTLQPLSLADAFTTSSSSEGLYDSVIDTFFPSDGAQRPLGGWRTFYEGRRVVAAKVDDRTMVVLGNLPTALFRVEVVQQGSYYVVSLVTLIGLFSVFSVGAITRPLRRIASTARDADLLPGPTIFEERGSVEIVAVARALNQMRGRIATMLESRTRMLRGISHDLRTPLTRLRLRIEQLPQPDVREALLADVDHLDRLLKESLSYLRDTHQREAVERADLAATLQTICNEFCDVGHQVTYSGPNRLIAAFRPLAIARAVTNLCENATKFGDNVTVELRSNAGGIVIDVADDGPGIPEEHLNKVLEPFYKADSARSGDTGFGLGLSIVSEIVEAHHGRLELQARQPNGLIARMILPVRP